METHPYQCSIALGTEHHRLSFRMAAPRPPQRLCCLTLLGRYRRQLCRRRRPFLAQVWLARSRQAGDLLAQAHECELGAEQPLEARLLGNPRIKN